MADDVKNKVCQSRPISGKILEYIGRLAMYKVSNGGKINGFYYL